MCVCVCLTGTLFFSLLCRIHFSKHSPREGVTTSSLFIRRVDSGHSGVFSCVPSNSESQSITVHVLKGESVNE